MQKINLYRFERKTNSTQSIAKLNADHFYLIDEYFYLFKEDGTTLTGPNISALSLDGLEVSDQNVATYYLKNKD